MIPLRYEKTKYEDVPKHVQDLFEKISETRRGLFITGNVGSGKTHIAFALQKYWNEKNQNPAEFWNTTELLREIRDDFDRGVYDKKRICEKLMDSKRLLFLDDIGSERATEFVQETFYLLINKRYNEMRPIIFTSNFSIGELSARIGDRTASRIFEMCDVIKLDGKDKRLAKIGV